MENEYISIKEFAELRQVTVQTIYNWLNNQDFEEFTKKMNGKTFISKAAADYKPTKEKKEYSREYIELANSKEETIKRLETKIELLEQTNELLKQTNELLKEQVENKDKQIEAQQRELEAKNGQFDTLTNLLNQQQQLTAMLQQKAIEENQEEKKGFFTRFKK